MPSGILFAAGDGRPRPITELREILEQAHSVAVVGIKDLESEDAYRIPQYLQAHGYRIVPVNPKLGDVLGHTAHASLREVDEPVDIGVEDLCAQCRICTAACPPEAISDEKQIVRGTNKWYVDFDRCVPYFSDTYGCAICLEVCPWSKPGRGPGLAQRLLAVRTRRAAAPQN